MLPLIEQELIAKRGWIEHKEFLDLLTLAQSVPGPIAVNTSVFVGYKMRGLPGSRRGTAGLRPAVVRHHPRNRLMFSDIRYNPVVDAAFKGMRPAVVALIVVPVFRSRGMRTGRCSSSSQPPPSPYGTWAGRRSISDRRRRHRYRMAADPYPPNLSKQL